MEKVFKPLPADLAAATGRLAETVARLLAGFFFVMPFLPHASC
jgi:hypothetical protein